ncbi:RagB/SusD family nutrient uptake outer membrane protein [Capnocytophaga leadbetteri]|uniref:RagB/SusD family nutrient uptake outer membrane protein n=1 Tax=Capnocytophaga leadbetteri TaxID=327575 RepID=A0A250FAK3_9FLAO|nr:RagB/SusD family nutrient uptake outer membrane protein [Capnocytophaga leadbetteri]
MKKILTFSILSAVAFNLTACKKDFLNTSPTEVVSTAPADVRLNGLYLMTYQTGTGGTSGHTDFGQKNVDICTDMLCGDMALLAINYHQYQDVANLKATQQPSDNYNYIPWRYYYRLIYEANKSIAELASPKNNSEKYILAQFRALRGYAYFYLMQIFTTKYEPDSRTNSIPLYTTADITSKPRVKQSEVYAQIISDLEFAVTNLAGFTRSKKGMIDKYVAEGLLAYTYAAMGNNQKVADLAQDIVNNSGYPLTTREQIFYDTTTKKGGGFNDVETKSWMWGVDLITENSFDLISWWGMIDIYTYSYAWAGDGKAMDDKLYAQIRTNDIRKKQFDEDLLPSNKFFSPDRVIGGQRKISTDYIYMRVDEFYLLAAEALAKLGQDAQAKTIYKKLLKLRYPEATATTDIAYVDALTNAQLQDDIYLNTRIELWGEGKSYFAMKRNHKTIERGSNHVEEKNTTFSYDNPRLTFAIPQNESINNLNL